MTARITTSLEDLVLLSADARGFSFLPRQPVSSLLAGRHASRLRGRGLAFEELRHYFPGDDVRTIDWKATARLRSPHVRVYSEERERPVLLIVDQRLPMFFGSRRAMKSVAAAEVAALGAWRALDSGDRVGGIVFNEAEIVEVRPHRSRNRVLKLFHEITRLNRLVASDEPAQGEITLNHALENTIQVAVHDYLVVVISDLDGADADTRRLFTLLAAHNDILVVAIYDPLGASLVGSPGMVATDRGTSWQIPSGESFSRKFQREFQIQLDEWVGICRNLRVPVLPISTWIPPVEQIRSLFGQQSRK